jgi:hypothetical protein
MRVGYARSKILLVLFHGTFSLDTSQPLQIVDYLYNCKTHIFFLKVFSNLPYTNTQVLFCSGVKTTDLPALISVLFLSLSQT